MKKFVSILAVTALTLVFGAAFADEMPTYYPIHKSDADKAVSEKIWDDMFNTPLEGTDVPDIYAFGKHETVKASSIGAAAGGVRMDKDQAERDRIFDALFNTPLEGTDVPDIYAFGKHETMKAVSTAAGGVRIDKEQAERDLIWDKLFNTPLEGTDVPDIYAFGK